MTGRANRRAALLVLFAGTALTAGCSIPGLSSSGGVTAHIAPPPSSVMTKSLSGRGLNFKIEYPVGPYRARQSYPVTATVTNEGNRVVVLATYESRLFDVSVVNRAGREQFNSLHDLGNSYGGLTTLALSPGKLHSEPLYFLLGGPGKDTIKVNFIVNGNQSTVVDRLTVPVAIP